MLSHSPRIIDRERWPGAQLLDWYSAHENPTYLITINVDVTAAFERHKPRGTLSSFLTYGITAALNSIEQYRLRLEGDALVAWQTVHPYFTVATDGDLFNFCFVRMQPTFEAFYEEFSRKVAQVR